jgi:hypothetical protein
VLAMKTLHAAARSTDFPENLAVYNRQTCSTVAKKDGEMAR